MADSKRGRLPWYTTERTRAREFVPHLGLILVSVNLDAGSDPSLRGDTGTFLFLNGATPEFI